MASRNREEIAHLLILAIPRGAVPIAKIIAEFPQVSNEEVIDLLNEKRN